MERRLKPVDKLLLLLAGVLVLALLTVDRACAAECSTDWPAFHAALHELSINDFRESTAEFVKELEWAGAYERTEAFWREVYYARESGYGAD